jgi:hypothetical protein
MTLDKINIEQNISNYLSHRAVNVCKSNSLNTLRELLNYYHINGGFLKLNSCDRHSNIELIKICKKYKDVSHAISLTIDETKTKATIFEKIHLLTSPQIEILDRHFEYLLSKLSKRAYDGLGQIAGNFNMLEIFEKILSDTFYFKRSPKIGKQSLEELEQLKVEIIKLIDIALSTQKDQLNKEYALLFLKSSIKKLPDNFEEQFKAIFDENGIIKLFMLLNLILDSSLFSAIEIEIFQNWFIDDQLNGETMVKIGNKHSLTYERIRQIKEKLLETIENRFSFISNFGTEFLMSYGIDLTEKCILINNTLVEKINEREQVKFNLRFYALVFGVLLKKTHFTLDPAKIIGINKNSLSKSQKYYLIDLLFFDSIELEFFIKDIYLKREDKKHETLSLNFQNFISNFIKKEALESFDEILSTCRKIIFSEFNVEVNPYGNIIFENIPKKKILHYCYEILEKADEPLTLEQIAFELDTNYSDLKFASGYLSLVLRRQKEMFVYFGQKGAYGLRKWEFEKDNIKGGTIRDIVEEFLFNEDCPKHISDIIDYVNKFRPETNARSLLTNIKVDERKRFCFFESNFIGLKEKNYTADKTRYNRLRGSYFRNSFFEKMIDWDIIDVINYYVKNYDYNFTQVEAAIQKKVAKGELVISHDNKLKIGKEFPTQGNII